MVSSSNDFPISLYLLCLSSKEPLGSTYYCRCRLVRAFKTCPIYIDQEGDDGDGDNGVTALEMSDISGKEIYFASAQYA